MSPPPRYLPDRPFPPYTYVPGSAPHPIRDPAGHMHGLHPETPVLLVDEWWHCEEYLWGIDLFNHGYYWEAHEAWEGLWHAAGRQGPVADFLKGLIKLAAAGVKTRENSREGQHRHRERARELFESTRSMLGETVMGLNVVELMQFTDATVPECNEFHTNDPIRVFPFVMQPCRSAPQMGSGKENS